MYVIFCGYAGALGQVHIGLCWRYTCVNACENTGHFCGYLRALLQVCRALLQMCRALLQVCRALLQIHVCGRTMIYVWSHSWKRDQTPNIWIFTLDSFPVRSFDWRGLSCTPVKNQMEFGESPWKLVWELRGLSENLCEILAVVNVS